MQHIGIVAVGKAGGYYKLGVDDYARRLGRFCNFSLREVAEEALNEKTAGSAQIAAALQKEGRRILAAIPSGAAVVALCVEGASLSTVQLAQKIGLAAGGSANMVFVIGSSHGLAPQVKEMAGLRLCLSALTLPHQMARLLLAEQIYRAFMIQSGAKYHK